MKLKLILNVVLFSFFSIGTNAQSFSLGIESGVMKIDGDIDSKLIHGTSIALNASKSINKSFYIQMNFWFGKTSGIESYPNLLLNIYSETDWFPNYEAELKQLNLGIGYKLQLFKRSRIKFFYGIGITTNQTRLNILDSNGLPYMNLIERTKFPNDWEGYDLDKLNAILDNSYETESFLKKGIAGNDQRQFYITHILKTEFDYWISTKMTIGLNAGISIIDNDWLDGVKLRTIEDSTNSNDRIHRFSLMLTYHLQ